MKASYIDYARAFHTYSKRYKLASATRSVYYALLGEFNAAHWTQELALSAEELAALAGVRTRETVHDAKNLLKETKWIDFRRGKNRVSVYRLLTDNLPDNEPADQPADLPDNAALRPKNARAQDVKTKRQDTTHKRGEEGNGARRTQREPHYRGDEPWLEAVKGIGGEGAGGDDATADG